MNSCDGNLVRVIFTNVLKLMSLLCYVIIYKQYAYYVYKIGTIILYTVVRKHLPIILLFFFMGFKNDAIL